MWLYVEGYDDATIMTLIVHVLPILEEGQVILLVQITIVSLSMLMSS